MINFLKQIFTWWHKHTVGTFIYTLFFGKFVNKDKFGNKYYSSSSGKRWVVYKSEIESTKIPPEWHSWIHFTNLKEPADSIKKFSWQKDHKENNTGSEEAYKPEGSLSFETKKIKKKYDIWKS